MTRMFKLTAMAASLVALSAFAPNALALRPGCTAPPCGGGGEESTATNRLSYPLILAEGIGPAPAEANWAFFDLNAIDPTDPTVCAQESGNTVPIPTALNCYYGRQRDADGNFIDGTTQVWWLAQRSANQWKVLSIAPDDKSGAYPVPVTAVDIGDLLESSSTIKSQQIRTEVSLLQDVPADDPLFGQYVTTALFPIDFSAGDPDGEGPCQVPNATRSLGCFAALQMSGAVPGTDQSINEIQGTNFGVDPSTGAASYGTASGTLIDPGTVKFNRLDPSEGYEATVYSNCGRLIIQRLPSPSNSANGAMPASAGATDREDPREPELADVLTWDSDLAGGVANGENGGYWADAEPPIVDIAVWRGQYTGEINAGGSLIMGYNWNTKFIVKNSTYRLTYVLMGGADASGPCYSIRNAVFDDNTKVVNQGEVHPAVVIPESTLGGTQGEGGAVYVEVLLGAGGGQPTR